jgi:hypothetical protein
MMERTEEELLLRFSQIRCELIGPDGTHVANAEQLAELHAITQALERIRAEKGD